MKAPRPASAAEARRFRRRLLLAMMVVVAACTMLALYLARRSIATDAQRSLEREFEAALATLHQARQVRHAALVERCRALARKPRILAALEDGGLDLLYLNAADELRDMLADPARPYPVSGYEWRARFYRFLDTNGRVIRPDDERRVGGVQLPSSDGLNLPRLPQDPQVGYLSTDNGATLHELIATSIFSSEHGNPIAALVLGFSPLAIDPSRLTAGAHSGVLYQGRLHLPSLSATAVRQLEAELAAAPAAAEPRNHLRVEIDGQPAAVFIQQLNPQSLYRPAYEVCLFPLTEMLARQHRSSWQILGAGGLLLIGSLGVSHLIAGRLSLPVARLVHESQEQRQERERAEAELISTHVELERTARFSADASHQLKTPVAVLRSGLEELMARLELTPSQCDEVSALIHQTYRLSSIIEDLLLLSRIDAGQLKIRFGVVDLSRLIEASLDDLSALPEETPLKVETALAPALLIAGERRYVSLILQNLLENARKYNRPNGSIRISARKEGEAVYIRIGNTTRAPIPSAAQSHIFDRFHRAGAGENVPGYGLGLNLARELARIHDGDLQLMRSDEAWTEFELRLKAVRTLTTTATDAHEREARS